MLQCSLFLSPTPLATLPRGSCFFLPPFGILILSLSFRLSFTLEIRDSAPLPQPEVQCWSILHPYLFLNKDHHRGNAMLHTTTKCYGLKQPAFITAHTSWLIRMLVTSQLKYGSQAGFLTSAQADGAYFSSALGLRALPISTALLSFYLPRMHVSTANKMKHAYLSVSSSGPYSVATVFLATCFRPDSLSSPWSLFSFVSHAQAQD